MNDSKSILQFNGYKILDFQFRMNPSAIEKDEREVGIGFKYSYNSTDETHFTVVLTCFINDNDNLPIKKDEEQIPFKITSSIEGSFSLNSSGEKYLPNAIAILFPYLRSFISTVTAQSGMPPFILPTFNILALLENGPKEEILQQKNVSDSIAKE